MPRLRDGAGAGITAFLAWGVAGAAEHLTANARYADPTRGVALYLGAIVAAVAHVFLPRWLQAQRSRIAWAIASASVASALLGVAVAIGYESVAADLPRYIVRELPASALGVLLVVVGAGRRASLLRVSPEVARLTLGFAVPTLVRCSACLLLVLLGVVHALWLSSWWFGSFRGFAGWLPGQVLISLLWIAPAIQLLLSCTWRVNRVWTAASASTAVLAWTATVTTPGRELFSLCFVLATCGTVALVASSRPSHDRR